MTSSPRIYRRSTICNLVILGELFILRNNCNGYCVVERIQEPLAVLLVCLLFVGLLLLAGVILTALRTKVLDRWLVLALVSGLPGIWLLLLAPLLWGD